MKLKGTFGQILLIACLASCSRTQDSGSPGLFRENYRPQFHFSPERNWTNDPNGLVYYDGEYHLFFQYNPYGDVWGHMSWGHAVSKDLLHWQQLPVAIAEYPDPVTHDSTMIFSGTVVVDKENTSGLCAGNECMVAIYTSHVHKKGEGLLQHQSVAVSDDKGRTWRRYPHNPVLNIGRKDFRDPKVFWYAPQKKWVMAAVIPDLFKVQFYQSTDLLHWNWMSDFGPMGDTLKIWECPDLFEVPVENGKGKKWVLSLSGSHPQGPGFVGMQYFVGNFDGRSFVPDQPGAATKYVNYGKDFYAGIIFNNTPETEGPIMLGWALNWTYARVTPTAPWRGAMSLPRDLALRITERDTILVQTPRKELVSLRESEIKNGKISGKALELLVEIDPGTAKEAGIRVLKSGPEETVIGYDAVARELFIDRTNSGNVGFHTDFASRDRVKLEPSGGKIKLHIFIDHSIIEVFANDGACALTDCVYPTQGDATVETYAKDGDASLAITGWTLRSIWE